VTAGPVELRRHARNVLQDVLRWRLTADRWADISDILDDLEAGLRLSGPGQLAALTEAAVALELSAPPRLTPVDKLAADSAPDSVRDRVNVLVHALTPPAAPATDETSGAAG
jgi:CATRA-Associated Small Protein